MLKVLLSAFEFEPNKGSEAGIGWHWAREIARLGHEVLVLTCSSHHKSGVENYFLNHGPIPNLRVIYYELPIVLRWWHKGQRGLRSYNFLWQYGAYRLAKRLHLKERFDLVHHVTWGGVRYPSFMGLLGIPFLLGPVGGGERAPWRLRVGYSLHGWAWDVLRDLSNILLRFDPFVRNTYRQATTIYAKTSQTKQVIPKIYHPKVRVKLEIGIEEKSNINKEFETYTGKRNIRLLYAGRFLHWKGMNIGLHAFSILLRRFPDARLTMVGGGSEYNQWRKIAITLGVIDSIDWISWVGQEKMSSIYKSHDVLLFPSLHDSSGNVVLEALAHGMPVVCLDLGGPAMIVDETCGRVIQTSNRSRSDIADAIAEFVGFLANDHTELYERSRGAFARASEFSWRHAICEEYKNIQDS